MFRLISVLSCLVFLLFLFVGISFASSSKYALLIGVSDYSASEQLASLDGTINDIELVRQILEQDRFGFKENITVLTNEKATHTGIRNAFSDLAGLVKQGRGGSVYIHYSGHGSTTPNLNDDDDGQFDETWVGFGSRSNSVQGDDRYDILDDELHSWLLEIDKYADELIFVSDSCHSGSVTRGNGLKTRAVVNDKRKHPLGTRKYNKEKMSKAVFLGASGDQEQAGEYKAEDGEIYGLFTWYWVQALESAKPGETWNDLLKKTRNQVQGQRRIQTPQISGTLVDSSVFKGDFTSLPPRIAISGVSSDGKRAAIKQGSLAGITTGSVYRLYDPAVADKEKLPAFTVASCQPFSCRGEVAGGRLNVNDLIYEESHAYSIKPIPVFIDGEFASNNDQVMALLRKKFIDNELPVFRLVDSAQDSRIILYVTRPLKAKDGAYVYLETGAVLPKADKDEKPEVWVMDNTMHLWNEALRLPFQNPDEGWKVLRENFEKISRSTELLRLASKSTPSFAVEAALWLPDENCFDGPDCRDIDRVPHRRTASFSMADLDKQILSPGDLLSFTLTNSGRKSRYGYLINIGPDGEILTIFPPMNSTEEDALFERGQSKESEGLELSGGQETVKLLVTRKPVDIRLFDMSGYRTREGTRGDSTAEGDAVLDPLNKLLEDAITNQTRGKRRTMSPDQWSTSQATVLVQE